MLTGQGGRAHHEVGSRSVALTVRHALPRGPAHAFRTNTTVKPVGLRRRSPLGHSGMLTINPRDFTALELGFSMFQIAAHPSSPTNNPKPVHHRRLSTITEDRHTDTAIHTTRIKTQNPSEERPSPQYIICRQNTRTTAQPQRGQYRYQVSRASTSAAVQQQYNSRTGIEGTAMTTSGGHSTTNERLVRVV